MLTGIILLYLITRNLIVFSLLISFVLLHLIIRHKRKKSGKEISKRLNLITDFIFYCCYIPFKLMLPATFIVAGLFILSLVAGVLPSFLLTEINSYFNLGLNNSTILFFIITLFSMIFVYGSGYIFKRFHKNRKHLNKDSLMNCIKDLMEFLFHKNNLNYLILLIYLLFLIYSSFYSLQNHKTIFGKDIDMAIIKAFLVYIGFTNLVKRTQKADFSVFKIYDFFKEIVFVRLISFKKK